MQIDNRATDFSKAEAEIASAVQESIELDRRGKFNDDAAAKLEARLGQISKRIGVEIEASALNSSARLKMARGIRKPRWLMIFASLVFPVLVVFGAILELKVGEGFIFSANNSYRDRLPILFLASALLCGAGLFCAQIKTQFMNYKAPTWFVRWLLIFPLLVLVCAASIVAAPLGWAALAGYLFGAPYGYIEVSVLSVEQIRQNYGKGCSQHARIDYQKNSASICLDGRLSGQIIAGEKALVTGRKSVFGLFIDEIRK